MFVHDYLRKHLLEQCGFFDPEEARTADLDVLKETEWNPEFEMLMRKYLEKLSKAWNTKFEKLMRNRLIMGSIRYGRLKAGRKPKYNRVDSIRQRLDLYADGGNSEHLVDIANLCLCEFTEPNHPKFHFKSTDDGIHTEEL